MMLMLRVGISLESRTLKVSRRPGAASGELGLVGRIIPHAGPRKAL